MNVFLMHGMSCHLQDCWGPYVEKEIKKLGLNIIAPKLALKDEITLEGWFKGLDEFKSEIDENSIFICHSLSTNFIAKYFAKNQLKAKALIAVAGGYVKKEREGIDVGKNIIDFVPTEEEMKYLSENIEYRYNFRSENDDIWTQEELDNYSTDLVAEEFIIENAGHFGRRSNVKEMPQIIEIIKNLM